MSGFVSHISCPACKGAVGVTNVDRILRCAFCEASLLVEHPEYIPQYRVAPQKNADDARRALQTFLTSPFLPKGLLRHARFLSATLCYVPFYEFKTRRLGTIETSVPRLSKTRLTANLYSDNSMEPSFIEKRETTDVRETEMVMGDICRVEPATHLERFGLAHCSIFEYMKGKPELHPLSADSSGEPHRIYPPTLPAGGIAERMNLKGFVSSVTDDTRYVESRTRLIYFPLWRLRYRFAGRLYSAVLDGVTGKLMVATAPEGEQLRVIALLAGITFFGIVLGSILRHASIAGAALQLKLMVQTSFSLPLFVVLAVIAAGMAGMWALVWNQFRWPGEVHKQGDEFHVEKYNGLLRRRIRLPLLTPFSFWKPKGQRG